MLSQVKRLASNITSKATISSSTGRRLASATMASATTLASPSITPVRKSELHESRPTWWLRSLFHFSFADHQYFDPLREQFGALRVVNDDVVQAQAGFGTHPHRDMEIFSYVVDGALTHQDSMGNKESLTRGSVQYMSAGTGVRHSEMNDGDVPVRFMQLWIVPDRRGYQPQYGSSVYTKEDRHNRLLHILGGTGAAPAWKDAYAKESIKLNQDANVYVSEADAGHSTQVELGANRQAYLVCIEGGLAVNDVKLSRHDAARIVGSPSGPSALTLTADKDGAHFLIVEMAKA